MKVHFYIENQYYGRGSANIKGTKKPWKEVESPVEPNSHLHIDGVWFTSKWMPSYHYVDGALDHIEMVIRPSGGMEELKWHKEEAPYVSENRGEEL